MTVASLWKALDRAGCGKRVGVKELLDHNGIKMKTTPWNVREMNELSRSPENQPVLAIDLSIWICEALTSSAMKHNHVADPPLQLVYSRALKLLTLGIKLVVVVEGKRRNRAKKTTTSNGKNDDENKNNDAGNLKKTGEDNFRKRRSGTMFWTACERCETMLKLLGVVVVRAKAEGEALCALLNQRGIVDGVISNDGDCLLFGAKVLYTKFSVENLDHSNVIRYDANEIRVMVDDDDTDKYDETGLKSKQGHDIVEMSRNDLIAFAILTGSDLAGSGLSKVGCRKAIRFIRKCQIDNPLKLDGNSSPAIEQLLSWGHTATSSSNPNLEKQISGPRCTCCGHLGTKKEHKKHGCKGCGTEPGEPCFQLSPGGRFRKLLRSKALNMQSCFDPSSTLKAYHEPNENQIPFCLVGKTSRTLIMNSPQVGKFLELSFIIRGRSVQESRESVRKSLSAYLARQELFKLMHGSTEEDQLNKLPNNRNRPAPVCVTKLVVRNGKPSCVIKWVIRATTSDAEGNPMDQYEFSTIEDEFAIKKCYPKLLHIFREDQIIMQQQGTAEQEKRRNFLLNMEKQKDQEVEIPLNGAKKSQTRKDYFDQAECMNRPHTNLKGVSDDVKAILIQIAKKKDNQPDKMENNKTDVHIGRVISTKTDIFREKCPTQRIYQNDNEKACIGHFGECEEMNDDSSTICTVNVFKSNGSDKNICSPNPQEDYFCYEFTPGHLHYAGIKSAFQFRCMASDDCHLRIDYARSNVVKDPSVIPVELNKENTCLVERKACSEQNNLESIPCKVFSLIRTNDDKVSYREYERLEELRERCYAKSPNTKDVVEGFSPVEEQLNFAAVIDQRETSRSPLYKRCKREMVKNNSCKIDNFFNDERAVSREDTPRARLFVSSRESFKQIHDVSERAINVDSDAICRSDRQKAKKNAFGFYPIHCLHDQRNERSEGVNKRNSVKVDSECIRRFDGDQCKVGCYGLQGKHECIDPLQSSFRDFDHKSYDRHSHIRGGKQNKRIMYHQAEFYDHRLENHHDQSEIDSCNDYNVTCYRLHQRQGEGSYGDYENCNAHKVTKISRTKILLDQSPNIECKGRGPKKLKKMHHWGVPNEGEDECNCGESRRLYCKRDLLHRDENVMTRPSSFNMLDPLKDRFPSQDPCCLALFEDRDDPQTKFCHAETLNQEIDREVIASRKAKQDPVCGLDCSLSENGYLQDQSNYTSNFNLYSDMQVIERGKLEKRVATKVESRNRRAQIGFLCSKYIGEECWNKPPM